MNLHFDAMAHALLCSPASQTNFLRLPSTQISFGDHFTFTLDCSSFPVVDLSSERTRPEVAQGLVKACEDYGFFKVVNHGVPQNLIDSMGTEAEKLFALPSCEKERAGPPDPYGYGNKCIGPNGDVGWIEYLVLRTDLQHIQERYKAISPDNYRNFCEIANKYISATRKVACDILELLAQGLGLPQNIFSTFITDARSDSAFRLNHYPPSADPSPVIGFGEHTDPQILSVLHSNDVGGLQILSRDGKWVTVSPDPSSFSIIIGDCMQVLTNGRFKSVRHRAVTNKLSSRISKIFFGAPGLDEIIATPSELLDEDHEAHFRQFRWCEYKKSVYRLKLEQSYGVLDTFRVERSVDNEGDM